jgi:uncharacterized protein YggE
VNVEAKQLLALIGIAVLATGCAGGLPVAPSSPSDEQAANTISVSGIGQVNSAPDLAYIQLGVEVTGPNVGPAVAQSNQTMQAVMEAIAGMGVAQEDIQTSGFNVWSEQLYDQETGQPTGRFNYHVQNMLNVTVRDVTKVGDVIQAGLDAGANQVINLSFSIEDTTELEKQARQKAVEDARVRAADLAEKLGVTLGEPIAVSEGSGFEVLPARYAAAEGLGGGGGPPISGGQMTVSVQVNMTFNIVR